MNAVVGAAKAANILDVPVVLSSINRKAMGEFIPEVSKMFPNQEVFARGGPSFDAFENEKTRMPLRSWIEIKWSFQDYGPACALHILLYTP